MRKDLLILFSILVLCQLLSANPNPEPEPQYGTNVGGFGGGAWLGNIFIFPVIRFIRYVYAMTTRMVTQISSSTVTIIKTVNITIGANVENFNRSCSKASENITEEFNIFTNESESMNSATTVLCSSAMLNANDNVQSLMFGVSTFMNSLSGYGPPPPMVSGFGDTPYPPPQSPMPAPPAPGAYAPYPPAISVQSRYARTVLSRMLTDVLTLVRVVDEFKDTTGSTCESVSETEVQSIKELFISVTLILNKYENVSTIQRLMVVLTPTERTQINRSITKMTDTVEFVKNSMKKGVKEIKTSRKTNAYQTIVQDVRENRKSSSEFRERVSKIRSTNEKSGKRYVTRAFNTARDSCRKAYKTVNEGRASLVTQSGVMVKTVRDNCYWIYEYVVKPKINKVQVHLDTIPGCLNTIFNNLTISISKINNNTEITNNNTFTNASTVVNQAVTNLTDIITNDCTCKINCAQAANEEIQEIQCKFNRDSKKCMEDANVFNQRAVTNCTNTTTIISQSLNGMVAQSDKCIRDTGAPNTYYVNFLSLLVRQKVVACLDPIEQKAGNFCADAARLSNGTRITVVTVGMQTTSVFKNCTNDKVEEALKAINVVSENYFTCSKTQPSPPPTTPGPTTTTQSTTTGSSTTGSSTTGSSTTGSSTTGSSTTGSSTTGSSTTGSSTTGSSTTGSSTTGSSTPGSSTPGSSSAGSTVTCGCTKSSSSTSTTGASTTSTTTMCPPE
ncbi:unnamed protein product [Diamesa tonsa]